MRRARGRPIRSPSYAGVVKIGSVEFVGGAAVVPDWAFSGTSLDMNFVTNQAIINGQVVGNPASYLTTTRASTAYSDTSAGVWSAFSSNIPRITDKGLLVEESRTNSIRNNSMQGAVAGTPGTAPTNWVVGGLSGLTLELVSVQTELGVDTIRYRLSGTTTSTLTFFLHFESTTQIAASQTQVWTRSPFLKVVSGSITGFNSINTVLTERNAGGTDLTNSEVDIKASLTSSLTRFSTTYTIAQATAAFAQPGLSFRANDATAVDITIDIGLPQLELGAFATSPIRTTSAAATRAADVVTVTSPPVFGSEWSLYTEFDILADTTGTFPAVIQIDDGSDNERTTMFVSTASDLVRALVTDGSVSQADFANGSAISYGAIIKAAAAYKVNDIALSSNGAAVSTDTVATMPTVNRVLLGKTSGGNFLNGHVRRAAIFPTRLTNAQLQA